MLKRGKRLSQSNFVNYDDGSVRDIVEECKRQKIGGFYGATAELVLARLAENPGGKVSVAMNMLQMSTPTILIFYLIQAADLAIRRKDIRQEIGDLANRFEEMSKMAAALAVGCRAQVEIHLWRNLPDLANSLAARAQHYRESIENLQISPRDIATDQAAVRLAIRHFRKMALPARGANRIPIALLFEVALNTRILNDREDDILQFAKEAFRITPRPDRSGVRGTPSGVDKSTSKKTRKIREKTKIRPTAFPKR